MGLSSIEGERNWAVGSRIRHPPGHHHCITEWLDACIFIALLVANAAYAPGAGVYPL